MGMTVAAAGKGRRGGPVPVMNVTPLVDVALVILIIFMVVTPLMTKTFWVHVPRKDEKSQDDRDTRPPSEADTPLVMTVDAAGTLRVNRASLTPDELRARLPRMLAAKSQKILHFDAHDRAPYGVAATALDIARRSGARTIAVTTTPLAL